MYYYGSVPTFLRDILLIFLALRMKIVRSPKYWHTAKVLHSET
jgi:hypothetical protein